MMEDSKLIAWYNNQLERDKIELRLEKQKFIDEIKSIKKEDLIHKQKPISIWKRLVKVLGF